VSKLSISLPWDYLADSVNTNEAHIIKSRIGPNKELLQLLKDSGITHIELRHRYKKISDEGMVRSVSVIKEFGLSLSIHGEALPEPKNFSFMKLFPWYRIVNDIFSGENIIVTFHPYINNGTEKKLAETTVEIFSLLLRQKEYPAYTYALENQRFKGYEDPAISFDGTVAIVQSIPEQNIGICWDMGHSFSNTVNFNHPQFPSEDFLSRVIHTHIHDLGPGGRTHWPFKENKVPLKENIRLLHSSNYPGAYNLELSFDRFAEEENIKSLLLNTIKKIRYLTGG